MLESSTLKNLIFLKTDGLSFTKKKKKSQGHRPSGIKLNSHMKVRQELAIHTKHMKQTC